LITVGIGVMDYKGLRAIPAMPRSEVIIMLIVMVLSSLWNLVYAVGIGLIIASLMFMKKIGDVTASESVVKPLAEDKELGNDFDFPEALQQQVFIKRVNGPLFFGSTSDFQSLAAQIPGSARVVVILMESMKYIDQSGLYAVEDVLTNLLGNERPILLVGVPKQPRYMMGRINIIPALIPADRVFQDANACMIWINENVKPEFTNH
jgi:SulP family sulfate permease